MKSKHFPGLFVALMTAWLCWPLAAPAADSTSFNPVYVSVFAESSGGVPVGTVVAWPTAINPEDWNKWLECNGQTIDALTYPDLAALMGARVPDLRGLFLRGYGSQVFNSGGYGNVSHTSGVLGQIQGDAIRNITGRSRAAIEEQHAQNPSTFAGAFYPGEDFRFGYGATYGRGDYGLYMDASRIVPTANENRPANMAVRYLIRAVK
jgi:hypothetical protein